MKKPSTSRQVQIFDAVLATLGRGLGRLFGVTGVPKGSAFDGQKRWQEIEGLLTLGGPAQLKQALIEADKLLDAVLASSGYVGNLGEKLRKARGRLREESYRAAWQAHTLRNRIVHEDTEVLDFEIKKAVSQIKKVVRELTG